MPSFGYNAGSNLLGGNVAGAREDKLAFIDPHRTLTDVQLQPDACRPVRPEGARRASCKARRRAACRLPQAARHKRQGATNAVPNFIRVDPTKNWSMRMTMREHGNVATDSDSIAPGD